MSPVIIRIDAAVLSRKRTTKEKRVFEVLNLFSTHLAAVIAILKGKILHLQT
jgi:hypothetical protein